MKRFSIGLLAATASLALLAGCGGTTPGTTDSSTPATTDAPPPAGSTIKIGVNLELSGAVATYGTDTLTGVKLAVKQINAAGGVKGQQLELVEYDNKSDPAEATALATKLMVQDKVIAVVAPATSGRMKAIIPVANDNKVPVVSGSATADDVTVDASGAVKEYAFRTCFNDSFQGSAMAKYANETLKAKSAAIIKDSSSDYAKGLADNFKKTFTAAGGTIVDEESYVEGDTDFNALLTKVRGNQFDVIYMPGYYQEAGLLIKAARELGITAPILGGDGFDSPTLLELGGAKALNDVFFTNHYSSLDKDPSVVKFIADYKAEYGKDPSGFAAMGYDTLNLIANAIGRATDLTGVGVKDALVATKDFPAVTGTLSIDPATHNPIKDIVVVGLKDGQQATSERIHP